MNKVKEKFIAAVDGGGTKTIAVISNLNGEIIGEGVSGSSNPRNVGISRSVDNIVDSVILALDSKNVKLDLLLVGIASLAEEFQDRTAEIEKKIKDHIKLRKVFKGRVRVVSDQLVAFNSGTDKKEGVVVISGTGSVARGWKGKKDIKVSGWGWLADEGSAFWVGHKVYSTTMKAIDGREKRSLLVDMVIKELKIKDAVDYNKKIYSNNLTEVIPYFSIIADKAALGGDKSAINIFKEAGKELALSANTVIKKLGFNKDFPLVLVGGMFKSKYLLVSFKKEVKKHNPLVKIIVPKNGPVFGAVKLAIGQINEGIKKS
ncbi:MAG: hypothetical protein KY054_01440 [Candidatus Nealsonbacteria bacterium]|nr:hypothetical protein [Candidatus Nealsonbacteria bacterium]